MYHLPWSVEPNLMTIFNSRLQIPLFLRRFFVLGQISMPSKEEKESDFFSFSLSQISSEILLGLKPRTKGYLICLFNISKWT